MVARAFLVSSWRVSVYDWLTRVLPAFLYVRPAESGDTAGLSAREQQAIAALPAIERVEFLRLSSLALDPDRPEVVLIARSIDINDPGKALPLVGEAIATDAMPGGVIPIWVSEAMVDLYAYAPGSVVRLSIGSQMREFLVAGVWRDYARQSGSIQMRLSDYRRLTGDHDVNDAALWLRPGMSAEQAVAQLKALPFGAALEFSLPEEIQAMSLRIFDRSFTITYLLEAVAIVIGLFGIAATFSAQTLARAREFGMLRHVGVMRRQVLAMLAIEGGLLTLLGIAVGFLLGGAISLILIFVVNPQSFHWSMQVHLPWELLLGVASVLLLAASVTAVMAGRHAISGDVVRAVREDW
jgi:putative ABC transport system permease protein